MFIRKTNGTESGQKGQLLDEIIQIETILKKENRMQAHCCTRVPYTTKHCKLKTKILNTFNFTNVFVATQGQQDAWHLFGIFNVFEQLSVKLEKHLAVLFYATSNISVRNNGLATTSLL